MKACGQQLSRPGLRADRASSIVGAIELRSCKHGDPFFQRAANGTVCIGIAAKHAVKHAAESWRKLAVKYAALDALRGLGVVIYDTLCVYRPAGRIHAQTAPTSMSDPVAGRLAQLAPASSGRGRTS